MGLNGRSNLCHADRSLRRKQQPEPVFTANKCLCGREFDCCVMVLFVFLNPDVLWIEPSGSPYDFEGGGGKQLLGAHTRPHIRTHPGGLLQMVATERVVQVEADNIAVRQAKVFAHRGCGVDVCATEPPICQCHTA